MSSNSPKIDLNNLDKSDWKTYRFDEICQSISERIDPTTTDLETYIGLEHLDSESIHIRRSGKPGDVKGQKLRFYPGDVIFGKRRAYQRKAAVATMHGFCSAHAMVLRANPEVIDPELFPFFLHSDTFMDRAVDISVGSLSPTINWKTLRQQKFLLPPTSQQLRYRELLSAIDAKLQKSRTVKKLFETFCLVKSRNMLKIQTQEGGDLPVGWERKSVNEIAPFQRGFDLPKSKLIDGNFPVGYSNGIQNFHTEHMVKAPGLWTGRSGTIGKIFYTDQDYWPHNTTLWVTEFKDNFPKYVFHLYRQLNFERCVAGTGVPTLNRNDIHKIKTLIPAKENQILIAKKLDELECQANEIDGYYESVKTVKNSLIRTIF